MLKLLVNDSTLCIKPLMKVRASWNCCSKDTIMGGDDGGEEEVEILENTEEVW